MSSASTRGDLPVISLVRVHNFSVSLDGFSAGADQSLEAPFGHAGQRLVRWFTGTRSFHAMQGQEGGSTGVDDAFASSWGPGIGAEIMGGNKFGPQRGPWSGEERQGWGAGGSWGETGPARNADRGARRSGRAGGVRSRRSIPPSSCSPIPSGPRSR